jgi:hypothetical protein
VRETGSNPRPHAWKDSLPERRGNMRAVAKPFWPLIVPSPPTSREDGNELCTGWRVGRVGARNFFVARHGCEEANASLDEPVRIRRAVGEARARSDVVEGASNRHVRTPISANSSRAKARRKAAAAVSTRRFERSITPAIWKHAWIMPSSRMSSTGTLAARSAAA